MRVYLAGAMTNPTRDLGALQSILSQIEAAGHEVPTRHITFHDGRDRDLSMSACDLAARDLAWIEQSDALIAEVSTPSHGVGIEVALATVRQMPVFLLFRDGVAVSRLLVGLSGIEAKSYTSIEEACTAAGDWLHNINLASTMKSHGSPSDLG